MKKPATASDASIQGDYARLSSERKGVKRLVSIYCPFESNETRTPSFAAVDVDRRDIDGGRSTSRSRRTT